jgi:hypothetical protein
LNSQASLENTKYMIHLSSPNCGLLRADHPVGHHNRDFECKRRITLRDGDVPGTVFSGSHQSRFPLNEISNAQLPLELQFEVMMSLIHHHFPQLIPSDEVMCLVRLPPRSPTPCSHRVAR